MSSTLSPPQVPLQVTPTEAGANLNHPVSPPLADEKADSPSLKGEQKGTGGVDPNRPIGPGNPPAHSMIKPGEVRNPIGAAAYFGKNPSAGAKRIVRDFLSQEAEILRRDETGKIVSREKKTRWNALMESLYQRAMKGDVNAIRAMRKFGFGEDKQPVEHSGHIGGTGSAASSLPPEVTAIIVQALGGMTDAELKLAATRGLGLGGLGGQGVQGDRTGDEGGETEG